MKGTKCVSLCFCYMNSKMFPQEDLDNGVILCCSNSETVAMGLGLIYK